MQQGRQRFTHALKVARPVRSPCGRGPLRALDCCALWAGGCGNVAATQFRSRFGRRRTATSKPRSHRCSEARALPAAPGEPALVRLRSVAI